MWEPAISLFPAGDMDGSPFDWGAPPGPVGRKPSLHPWPGRTLGGFALDFNIGASRLSSGSVHLAKTAAWVDACARGDHDSFGPSAILFVLVLAYFFSLTYTPCPLRPAFGAFKDVYFGIALPILRSSGPR